MTAYYNEIDPFAAEWLRQLIKSGHIAPGDVDTRSIEDVTPNDLAPYTQCHFFAGIGVWSYALRQAGWSDDKPVWTGSCPCQPFSKAGKGGGIDDERHLWPAFLWHIQQQRPPVIFGEQVASKAGLGWWDIVSADLEGTNYACGAVDLCAAGVGAPHIRQRLFWVANTNGDRLSWPINAGVGQGTADDDRRFTHQRALSGFWADADWLPCTDGKARAVESGVFPMVNGASARVGRLRGYGNAIVAPLAAEFIKGYQKDGRKG